MKKGSDQLSAVSNQQLAMLAPLNFSQKRSEADLTGELSAK